MTLIECFDRQPVRNIVACLRLRPSKLVFLGDKETMEQQVSRYRDFFARRGMDTKVLLRPVRMEDMDDITRVLADTVQAEGECVIDVTGGEEQLLMAVGAVMAQMDEDQRKRVTVQKFQTDSGTVRDCDGDGKALPGSAAELTVSEIIALHGGVIHPWGNQPGEDHGPEVLQALWETVCGASKNWNKAISYMNEFEKRSESKVQIYLELDRLAGQIRDFDHKEATVRQFIQKLERCGVVRDRSTAWVLRYDYLDPILQACVKKAGNILEYKTLLEARSLRRDGKPYFHDCLVGVNIDWDGEVFDPEERVPETRNEIDVLLMRGMTPLFISCKNGDIGDDELYKLNTVAERFGGPNARKMLIATDLERKGPMSNLAFAQRAEDMGIYLVAEAAELTARQWKQIFIEAMGE